MDLPAGLYRGTVEGVESGHCTARIEVRLLPGGCLSLDYEAVGAGGLQHAEHTILSPGHLHVVMEEAPGVQVFSETAPGTFDGPPEGPLALRIVAGWDGTELTWAWHWAERGGAPVERSRAVVRPS